MIVCRREGERRKRGYTKHYTHLRVSILTSCIQRSLSTHIQHGTVAMLCHEGLHLQDRGNQVKSGVGGEGGGGGLTRSRVGGGGGGGVM